MGFFNFFTKELAIDLGTANTLIVYEGEIVVDSPSIVAKDLKTGKIIAVGKEAAMMQGKEHKGISIIRPLKDGVIADFEASEQMIQEFIRQIPALKKSFFTPKLKMVICIPSGITEVEKRAVRDSAEKVNASEVYLIPEPMAAAIGMGIDITKPQGNMVIDIGGGTTEIAVISLGGIHVEKSVKIAGDVFNDDIAYYMRAKHNLIVGERTAEKIKINVGSAVDELSNPPEDYPVRGRDVITGKPKEVIVSYNEIAKALDKSLVRIESAIMETLSKTAPELSADIYKGGLFLAGGGSLLRGLDKRISEATGLPVHVAEDPLRAVIRGTGMVINNFEKLKVALDQ